MNTILVISFFCWLVTSSLRGSIKLFLWILPVIVLAFGINGEELIGSGYFIPYMVEMVGVFFFNCLLAIISLHHLGKMLSWLNNKFLNGGLIK